MNADFVTDDLMVGGKESPLDHAALRQHGIRAILNVGAELNYAPPPDITVAKIALIDSGDNSPLAIQTAVSTLSLLLATRGKTLVHCAVGGSRSVTVACCYLVLSGQQQNFAAALAHVKLGRKCASPNTALRALAESLLNDRPALPALAEAIAQFDEAKYLARYPDVARDVKAGGWKNGLEHFRQFGFREGRSPH